MKNLIRIFKVTKELWPSYVWVSLFSILVALTSQIQPLLTKGAIDEASKLAGGGEVNFQLIVLLIIGMFLADVSQTFFSNIGGYIGDILQAKLRRSLGTQYFRHILRLPQKYFDSELTGTILNRLDRSINQISFFIQAMSNNFLQFIFSTIFSLIIVFQFSWQVGLLLASLYPVFIYLTTRTSGKWREYQQQSNEQIDRATGRFNEAIGQVKVVKSFQREADELEHFDDRMVKAIDITRPQSRMWHTQDVLRRSVLNLIYLGVFGFVFWQMAHGDITIGTAVLLLQYAMNIRMPIFSISFIIDNAQRAIANSAEYFKAMDQKTEDELLTEGDGDALPQLDGASVKFDKVSFGYTDDKKVLNGMSFELATGSKTALVGESGEGKTTITTLLLGFYRPDAGSVSVGGVDLSTLSRPLIRELTAVVFQEPALFSGSIYENIAYGREGAKRSEVVAAAKAANAHEFITGLKSGYKTEIGERGLKLSGGQKQRIAIARAILKDAPILVLDEATSSLDTKSERLVQQALERLMKGRTTIIIAHRLSTIQTVDNILTIKNGKINEMGSPAELSKTGGIYAELLGLQLERDESSRRQLKSYEMEG